MKILKRLINELISFFPIQISRTIRFVFANLYFPNYRNPKKFNEIINYFIVKRDNSVDIKSTCDKLKVRELAVDVKNLHTPELLGVFENEKQLELTVNVPWVIKPNYSSGKILFGEGPINEENRKNIWNKIKCWDNKVQVKYLNEWPYLLARRVFIIEKRIQSKNFVPKDYKFFSAKNEIICIQVDSGRYKNHVRNFYDEHWRKLDLSVLYPNGPLDEKPSRLEQMIEIARNISKNFRFIRVDLYFEDNKIYLGELTPFPGSGLEKFSNTELELKFGSFIKI